MRLGLGLGLPYGGGAATFSPLSLALFEAMEVEPDGERKVVIDTFIRALVAAGVWDLLDVLHVYAAHTEQAALLNWVDPGTFDATHNGATFAADEGFTGDGVNDFINTNFNPTAAAGNFSLNSAHLSVRSLTDVAAGDTYLAGGNETTNPRLRPNTNGTNWGVGINTTVELTATLPAPETTAHHYLGNRSGATAQQAYLDGAEAANNSEAASVLPNVTLAILGLGAAGGWGAYKVASFSAGASLSAGLVAAYHTAELAYMQAVGAV
jgi:hypothetical protein